MMNKIQRRKRMAAACVLSTVMMMSTACGSELLSDSSALTSTQVYQVEDITYTEADATMVTFTNSGVQASGKYDSYEIEETTFTITGSGTYVLTGSCTDGNIVIAKDVSDVTVVLNGLSLTSTETAAFHSKSNEDVTLVLQEGSVNELSDTDRSEEKPKGCLKTDGNLTIEGTGSLTINGNNKQAVKVDGTLTMSEASIMVTAKDDGFNAGGDLTVVSGSYTINAGGDGMHSDAVLTLGEQDASDDRLTVTVSQSEEGLEGTTVNIYSGNIDITSSDDGINSAEASSDSESSDTETTSAKTSSQSEKDTADSSASGDSSSEGQTADISGSTDAVTVAAENETETQTEPSAGNETRTMPGGMAGGMAGGAMTEGVGEYHINIYGGNIRVKAGGDGIDANGSIYVYGGTVDVSQSGGGNGIFDVGMTFEITGGTVFGSGSSDMVVTPQSGDNTLPYVSFTVSSKMSEGAAATITDSDGNVIWSGTIHQTASMAIFSSSDLTEGSTYQLNINGSSVAESTATTESRSSMGGGMAGGMNNGRGMMNDSSGMTRGRGEMKGGMPSSSTSGTSDSSGSGSSTDAQSQTGETAADSQSGTQTAATEAITNSVLSTAVEV